MLKVAYRESVMFCIDLETKWPNVEWVGEYLPRPQKFRFHKSKAKTMLIVFLSMKEFRIENCFLK